MKRTRDYVEHLREPFSLLVTTYFHEENQLLSQLQRRVICANVENIKRMRERIMDSQPYQPSVDELEESVGIVQHVYGELIETRVRELEDDYYCSEVIEGEVRVIEMNRIFHMQFIRETVFRLSLSQDDFLSIFNQSGIESAYRFLATGACHNPLIFLRVSKSASRMVLEDRDLVRTLLEKCEVMSWFASRTKQTIQKIQTKHHAHTILRLIQLDNDFKDKVNLLYKAARVNNTGYPYSTGFGCLENCNIISQYRRCYCQYCRYKKYRCPPAEPKQLRRNCPGYVNAYTALMRARQRLADFVFEIFRISMI